MNLIISHAFVGAWLSRLVFCVSGIGSVKVFESITRVSKEDNNSNIYHRYPAGHVKTVKIGIVRCCITLF